MTTKVKKHISKSVDNLIKERVDAAENRINKLEEASKELSRLIYTQTVALSHIIKELAEANQIEDQDKTEQDFLDLIEHSIVLGGSSDFTH